MFILLKWGGVIRRHLLGDEFDHAIARVSFAAGEVMDEPIQPKPGFRGLVGEE